MSVSPARKAAFRVLLRVLERDSFAVELLHSSLLENLSLADRALATELVMGTLRWQANLDRELAQASGKTLGKFDPEVLISLRLGAYQLRHLDRIPQRAAVNESVELVKAARKGSAAPLVNAVLRKLAQSPAAESPEGSDAATLASRYSHPDWLVARWLSHFGAERTQHICAFGQQRPHTAIRVTAGVKVEELAKAGVTLAAGSLVRGARRVLTGDISATRAYAERRLAVQDEASQLVAALVGHGRRILECCAAPGGKIAAIAGRNPEAEIVAAELHPHRARLMASLVSNPNVAIVAADARELPLSGGFDRILADLPCSGTGTLARNPEIKWKLSSEDLDDLAGRQRAILHSALAQLAPAGRLVFSTCSLEPEEGEQVLDSVLSIATGIGVVRIRPLLEDLRASGELLWPDLDSLVSGDYLRTVPGIHPCDGFFAAVVERLS